MANEQAPAPPRRPDAVRFRRGFRPPVWLGNPVDSIITHFERVLGGPAHVRAIGDGATQFVSRDPRDTLLFPTGHPHEKFPRYDWVDRPDGTQYGYLKSADDAARAAQTPGAPARALATHESMLHDPKSRARALLRWRELAQKPEAERTGEERAEYERLDGELFPPLPTSEGDADDPH